MCEEKNATMKSSVADIEDAIRQLAEYQSASRGEEQAVEDAERQRDLVIAVLESVRRAMNGDKSFILPVEIPEDAFDIDDPEKLKFTNSLNKVTSNMVVVTFYFE